MRILIVEDEDILRSGLKKMILRKSVESYEVYTASNGDEGLYLARTYSPDIVITDIRMPGMDGLQFLEQLTAEAPKTRTVVLSGYNDFQYAQKAIKLCCSDYLLKPLNFEGLHHCLDKIVCDLQNEREILLHSQKEKALFRENQMSFIHYFYKKVLIQRSDLNEEAIIHQAELFNITLKPVNYCFMMVTIDGKTRLKNSYSENDWELMKYAIHNITEEVTDYSVCFFDGEERILVLSTIGQQHESEIEELSLKIQKKIADFTHISVTIGFSVSIKLKALPSVYKEFKKLENYRMLYGAGTIFNYTLMKDYQEEEIKEHLNVLNTLLDMEDARMMEKRMLEWCISVKESRLSMHSLKKLENQVTLFISAMIRKWNSTPEYSNTDHTYTIMKKLEAADSFHEKMLIMVSMLKEQESQGQSHRFENKTVQEAIQFIQERYRERLTLAHISDHVYMNPAYFSVLFKKKTGESVIQYLTKLRMEKAKEYLLNLELKTYQIAEQVSYDDPSYFSTLFKKHSGFSPQEYRNLNLNTDH